jgi:hypothetical protein
MRIVIYPHSMEFGGSQRSAIDFAASLQSRGHDVLVFSPAGALLELVKEKGLRHVLAPRPRIRPSFSVMRRLCAVVDDMDADMVHAFEWPPAMETAFGPHGRFRSPSEPNKCWNPNHWADRTLRFWNLRWTHDSTVPATSAGRERNWG